MSNYRKQVADRILPLSISSTVPEAFREWTYSGSTHDFEAPIETCELCGQEKLRYHFEIENQHNGNRLDVGSECILRFEVPIYEAGRELSPSEARSLLKQHIKQMRLESCIRALEKLAETEDNRILEGALSYYRRNKKLTPKQANVVFWRLQKHQIDHDASFFAVRLDKQNYVDDLTEMPTPRVHRFWKALSQSQRKKAIEIGHRPPRDL